ncbi:uncharacterized protein LOC123640552 [Lemur catta]|uniref:uncharacterized protein LOC123640552 n=1 Tax=Lemur catta TaxID=9447 RepID=UPI001E269E69|nr:uncharacterized protein LOC123640552 [Lemur catta]
MAENSCPRTTVHCFIEEANVHRRGSGEDARRSCSFPFFPRCSSTALHLPTYISRGQEKREKEMKRTASVLGEAAAQLKFTAPGEGPPPPPPPPLPQRGPGPARRAAPRRPLGCSRKGAETGQPSGHRPSRSAQILRALEGPSLARLPPSAAASGPGSPALRRPAGVQRLAWEIRMTRAGEEGPHLSPDPQACSRKFGRKRRPQCWILQHPPHFLQASPLAGALRHRETDAASRLRCARTLPPAHSYFVSFPKSSDFQPFLGGHSSTQTPQLPVICDLTRLTSGTSYKEEERTACSRVYI